MALTEIRTITRIRHPERVVMANSRVMACVFKTHHENITDVIDTIFDKSRGEVAIHSKLGQMFEPVDVVSENGENTTDYYMNKDGFLLVMMKMACNGILESINLFWIIEYLTAFNQLQEQLIKDYYVHEYWENAPDRHMMVSDILQNASMQGAKKLEAALTYYADYIPDRLHEIYKPVIKK